MLFFTAPVNKSVSFEILRFYIYIFSHPPRNVSIPQHQTALHYITVMKAIVTKGKLGKNKGKISWLKNIAATSKRWFY